MSIHSKARRDARRKKMQAGRPVHRVPALRPHAHLLDGEGAVIGGAGLRGVDWVMVVSGKEVASTDSAGMILAMLRHVAALREAEGLAVQLNYSTQLRDAATAEAIAEDMTLDAYLDLLEQERREHAERRQRVMPKIPGLAGTGSIN